MTLTDTLSLSFRNLRQSKLRTTLTTLGVSIGIASLAGMVSLGVGLQDQVLRQFLQAGVFDAITVTSPSLLGAAGAILSGRGGRRGGPGPGGARGSTGSSQPEAPPLNEETLKRFSAMEHVLEVYPNIRVLLEIKHGEFSRVINAAGIPMSAKGVGSFQSFSFGRFFTGDSQPECIISLDLAKQLDGQNPGNLIGMKVTLSYAAATQSAGQEPDSPFGFQVQRSSVECTIAGIVERDTGPLALGGGAPAPLMLPIGLAKAIDSTIVTNGQSLLRDPSQPKSYPAVMIRVKEAKFTTDVEERLRREGYAVFSINDALRGAKNAFIIIDIVLSLIGSIALAVSSLGIVNTMVMSILERTREIGIMKAIGASNEHIRRIFLIEASAIGLMGGLVGVTLGWIVGRAINFGANLYIASQGGTPGTLFSLPLWLVGGAIAFSIAVSLLAGSYPAARAARLDPIQALRHD